MRRNRIYAVALTLGLAATPAIPVLAQDRDDTSRQGQYQNEQGQYGKDTDQDRHDHDQGNLQNGEQRDRDQSQNWNHDNDRDHSRVSSEQDYSNSKYYKLGYQDGMFDRDKNHRHDHNRKFENDNDRGAYQAGYEAAFARQQH